MEAPDQSAWNYVWLSIMAALGVLARAARWTTPEGKFDWRKAALELVSAPAIGVIVGGVVQYVNPDLDQRIINGLAALAGLIGVAAIDAIAVKWLEKKVGQ